jgi:hypothetical protein
VAVLYGRLVSYRMVAVLYGWLVSYRVVAILWGRLGLVVRSGQGSWGRIHTRSPGIFGKGQGKEEGRK